MHTLLYRLDALDKLVDILRQGGLIAYPTEGVFGLGCDPDCDAALDRLRQLKSRQNSAGFIVIGDCVARFSPWLSHQILTDPKLMNPVTPPTTWLVPAEQEVSSRLNGVGATRLAVRVVEHAPTKDLCAAFGKALVSTSANPAGQPAAMDATQTLEYFSGEIDAILDEPTGGAGGSSRIADFVTLEQFRLGGCVDAQRWLRHQQL